MISTAAPEPVEVDAGSRRRWLTITACLVVIVGLTVWFRFRAIGVSSLWLDDAWVGVGAHFPTIGDTISSGLTSPGFSAIYRGWATVFGTGATTAQLLSLAFAVAAPIVIFLAATERGLPWFAGLFGAGLLATAPAHIDMSMRLKQYTAEAFAASVVLWLAWRVLDRTGSSGRWAAFTAAAVGASLLSGIGALIAGEALAVCLVAAWLSRPRQLRAAVIATAVFGLLVAPWMLLVVRPNIHPKLADYWRGFYLDGNGFAGGLGTRLQVMAHGFQALAAPLVLLVLAVALGIVLVRRPLVGCLLGLPTLAAVVLAALSLAPIGTGRTDVYLFPSWALLVAVAVAEIAAVMASRGSWATGATVGVVLAALVVVALAASPSPTKYKPCVDPPVVGSTLMRCAYPQEDLTPLVHQVERERRPGDKVVVYPSAGYAYGIATRYPIEKRPDVLAPTDWVVKVRGPNLVVLEAHRKDTEKWAGPLDRLTAGSPRIWLIGTHFFPDWPKLKQMLADRGYYPVRVYVRSGAELDLFVLRSSLASATSPSP